MRKSSGGERAWFLVEESEPRNKLDSLAGGIQRAEASIYQTVLPTKYNKIGDRCYSLEHLSPEQFIS